MQKGVFQNAICRLLKCRCELVLQQWLFFTDSFLYCYHSAGWLKTLCLSHNDFLSTYYIYAFRQTLRVFTYVSSLQIIDFLWLGWSDIDNAINLCWLPSQYDFHIICRLSTYYKLDFHTLYVGFPCRENIEKSIQSFGCLFFLMYLCSRKSPIWLSWQSNAFVMRRSPVRVRVSALYAELAHRQCTSFPSLRGGFDSRIPL